LIDRFNFYDIFGYLIPGLILFALLWLPFGIVLGTWPSLGLAPGLAVLAFAYAAGHILHSLSGRAFPHADPMPHDALLDPEKSQMPPEIRKKLYEAVHEAFGLDLEGNRCDGDTITRCRQEAFYLCRAALMRSKGGSYAEHFQGMYALTRSLAAALVFGAAYHLGWAVGGSVQSSYAQTFLWVTGGALALLAVAAFLDLFSPRSSDGLIAGLRKGRIWFLIVSVLALLIGLTLGCDHIGCRNQAFPMFGIALGALPLAYICRGRFEEFEKNFAAAVYRDFLALHPPSEKQDNNSTTA
jgi:hypothetical protein